MSRTFPEDCGADFDPLEFHTTGINAPIWVDGGGLGGGGRDNPPRAWEPELYVGDFPRLLNLGDETQVFAVSLSDNPQVVYGTVIVDQEELENIFKWVKINLQALLDYWNQKTDSLEFVRQIRGNKVDGIERVACMDVEVGDEKWIIKFPRHGFNSKESHFLPFCNPEGTIYPIYFDEDKFTFPNNLPPAAELAVKALLNAPEKLQAVNKYCRVCDLSDLAEALQRLGRSTGRKVSSESGARGRQRQRKIC